MSAYSEEFLRQAEADHCTDLAKDLTDSDFEPPALDELRRRHQRERRALRTWLRQPSPRPAPPVAGGCRTNERHLRGGVRRRRSRRRAASSAVRSARGDPDGDPDPDGPHCTAEGHAHVWHKSLGELIGHAQQRDASSKGEGEVCW
jgi:hypothetical protein